VSVYECGGSKLPRSRRDLVLAVQYKSHNIEIRFDVLFDEPRRFCERTQKLFVMKLAGFHDSLQSLVPVCVVPFSRKIILQPYGSNVQFSTSKRNIEGP